MIIFSYLLFYGLMIPVSLLPFRFLYLLSDFAFLIFFYVIGYRRKIVQQNLKNSFPDKSTAELKIIERKFYRHMCDIMVETFKTFTISRKSILRRMKIMNPEIVEPYYDQGRSIMLCAGHYGNWEWFTASLNMQIKYDTYALFAHLKNKFFDKRLKAARSRFGTRMISIKHFMRFFIESKEQLKATTFGIDQSPLKAKNAHWMTFLNQDTGVMYGVEKSAKSLNYPVFFIRIEPVKRGYYHMYLDLVSDNPQQEAPFHIIEKATKMLEAEIIKQPQYWLWTHRRWKRKRPESTI